MKNSSSKLHPRNPHQGRYDLKALVGCCPELANYLVLNPRGEQTVNFSNEKAVRLLNQALLAHYYKIAHWDIPQGYLCPPIPGRADYIHYAADLLMGKKNNAQVLDIGTGANCIYPIIGNRSYGWKFVASDIDPISVNTAKLIVDSNSVLKNKIKLIQQKNSRAIFAGIIGKDDIFDLTLCNPPFHASLEEANAGTLRKQSNLTKHSSRNLYSKRKYSKSNDSRKSDSHKSEANNGRNFGGQTSELWCAGGEIAFLKRMVQESKEYSEQVLWFTSLVSKSDNVKPLKRLLKEVGARHVKVVAMSQGQKVSRLIAWTFLTDEQQIEWNSLRSSS